MKSAQPADPRRGKACGSRGSAGGEGDSRRAWGCKGPEIDGLGVVITLSTPKVPAVGGGLCCLLGTRAEPRAAAPVTPDPHRERPGCQGLMYTT